MKIDFPNNVLPKATRLGTVAFQATVDGDYLWCEISCEALRDHFGAPSMDGNDLLQAFLTGRARIEQAAHRHLESNGGRPVLLMAVDF